MVARGLAKESLPTEARHDALCTLGRILAGFPPEAGLEWQSLVSLARRYGVSPLLWWRLQEAETASGVGIPVGIQAALREDLHTAAAHGMVAEHQLAEVLAALRVAEVPSIVLKGAAVAVFYQDRALRRFGDLDLWIQQSDLPRAEQVLLSMGYTYTQPKAWWLSEFQHLPPLKSGRGAVLVELHWCLDRDEWAGRLPVKDLWARAVPWRVGGQAAFRLDPVDTALHLCRHAVVQHRARLGLRSLCDLYHVTRAWEADQWAALVQRAREYGLARPVFLMLTLTDQVLGRSAPSEVLCTLEPPREAAMPDDLIGSFMLLDGSSETTVPLAVVKAGYQGTLARRLRYVLRHLFLPRDGMAVVYGVPADSPRIWLAYLWRPLDLLGRYGKSVWYLARGQRAASEAWAREAWLEEWLRTGQP
jgi:hypothetical protein